VVVCPACKISMKAVTARANPGSLIQLDQCPQCGGIWCDKWELFPIQADEAARLEPVNQELLRSLRRIEKRKLYCPRCTASLAAPREPLLGPDLQLRRCPKCDGIWLNRGQFSKYKHHQKRIREEKLGTEAIVRKVEEIYQDPKHWVVTGTKGMFAHPRGMEEESNETLENTMRGGLSLVLQTLVRMAVGI
jgi:Zn-finger nucleic acid-binding protein